MDNSQGYDHEAGAAHRKVIWKTFWILLAITVAEFTIAFSIPNEGTGRFIRISIFVIMTIVKAGYIIGEFMHLRHEAKSLFWTILLPIVFVAWLLGALMWEGGSIFASHHP